MICTCTPAKAEAGSCFASALTVRTVRAGFDQFADPCALDLKLLDCEADDVRAFYRPGIRERCDIRKAPLLFGDFLIQEAESRTKNGRTRFRRRMDR